jgi:branched-subunit amino acid transport protein AzlD
MNTWQAVLIVLLIGALTLLARAFPFLLFGRGGETPHVAKYLGEVLPPAVMMILIVYCLRNGFYRETPIPVVLSLLDAAGLSLSAVPTVFLPILCLLPEIVAIALVLLFYRLTANTLLAMVGGTVLYMFLIQF